MMTWEHILLIREAHLTLAWWFLFSVVGALFHLIVGGVMWLIPWGSPPAEPFNILLRTGSLLFFAASLTSSTSGKYFQSLGNGIQIDGWVLFAVVASTIVILPCAVFFYGIIVHRIHRGIPTTPALVITISSVIAGGATLYGALMCQILT